MNDSHHLSSDCRHQEGFHESGRQSVAAIFGIFLIFASVSLLSSPLPGVNEPHYLAKARAFTDPGWCARDFFLSSGNAHYCFFLITGQLTRWLTFDETAIWGRIVSCGVLALGWNCLGRTLRMHSAYRLSSAAVYALISMTGSFSGEWLLGGFESKVPAWGLGLISIGWWIRGCSENRSGDFAAAGLACGLSAALHPVVGGWIGVCLSITGLCTVWSHIRCYRTEFGEIRRNLLDLFLFGCVTLMFSLPGLVPAIRFVLDDSLPAKQRELASFYQVFWRLRHHLDPAELTGVQWTFGVIVSAWAVFSYGRLQRLNVTTYRNAVRLLFGILLASGFIAMAGVLIGWHSVPAKEMQGWEWRAGFLRFYPFRCFDGLLPIVTGLFQGLLLQRYCCLSFTDELNSESGLLRPSVRLRILMGLSLILPGTMALAQREAAPPGFTRQQYADWQDACRWLKQHTPADALILTPRESFGFKWFSERAEFVCYKDCPQDPAGILMWNKRLWMLHDWTLSSSSDLKYDDADLIRLRKLTGCDFLVTRILGPFESAPVWQGQEWKIYRVPSD